MSKWIFDVSYVYICMFYILKVRLGDLNWSKFTKVLQKVLSLGSDYFSATFYKTYFYYKPSKYSHFTEAHFCDLYTQSRKADK